MPHLGRTEDVASFRPDMSFVRVAIDKPPVRSGQMSRWAIAQNRACFVPSVLREWRTVVTFAIQVLLQSLAASFRATFELAPRYRKNEDPDPLGDGSPSLPWRRAARAPEYENWLR